MGCASFKFSRNGSWSFREITISLWYTENAEDHLKIAQPNLCGFSYSVVDQWKCSGLPFQTNTKQNPDTNNTHSPTSDSGIVMSELDGLCKIYPHSRINFLPTKSR